MKPLILLIAALCLFAPAGAAAAPLPQETGGEAYSVQANDWLSKLAEKYYGDMFAYPAIVDATNAKAAQDDSFTIITNPDLIEIGQKLWIPALPTSAAVLTAATLKNATYSGIYNEPITLSQGRYEGEPFVAGGASRPTVTFVELYALGDLNGDGADDAAVLLAENSGGSGVFTYLAAVTNHDGQAVNAATLLLGDRTELKAIAIKNGQITLGMVTQGPTDPMCCPSLLVRQTYALQDNALTQTAVEEVGPVSAAALEGVTWTLVSYGDFTTPTPVLPGADITARFSVADGKITGSAGCNTYFASFTEEAGRALTVGPAGSTMMACDEAIMNQETAFLSTLGAAKTYRFINGTLLVISEQGALTFAAR